MRATPGHTLALARRLRALGGLKPLHRVGRVPPQLPPTNIEQAYFNAISAHVVAGARHAFQREAPEILRLLRERRHHMGKTDGAPRVARADIIPLLIAVAELLIEVLGEEVVAAALEVVGEYIAEYLAELTSSEVAQAILQAAVEIGIVKAKHEVRQRGHRRAAQDAAGGGRGAGGRIGRIAGARLAAIGAGRAAQLGKAAGKKEERQQRQRSGEVGEELERASRQGKRAADLIDRVASRFADEFRPHALLEVVKKFGDRTSEHNKRELDKQVRAAIGVPLSALEKPVRDHIEEWAAANIDLIKSISDRYFDRLRLDVEHAFEAGTHPTALAEDFEERYGMADNDARRIARDQIGKLNGQVNKARQEALGVTHYIWRTMRDNRVRDEHHAIDGKRFAYNDPPPAGPNGEPANPGEAIQCRCYAEPDFATLLAAA